MKCEPACLACSTLSQEDSGNFSSFYRQTWSVWPNQAPSTLQMFLRAAVWLLCFTAVGIICRNSCLMHQFFWRIERAAVTRLRWCSRGIFSKDFERGKVSRGNWDARPGKTKAVGLLVDSRQGSKCLSYGVSPTHHSGFYVAYPLTKI